MEGDSSRAVMRELMLHAEFLKLLAKQEEEESDLDMLASLCCDVCVFALFPTLPIQNSFCRASINEFSLHYFKCFRK